MASVLHGSARTTPRLRAEFQASQASSRSLAARYGVNPKTVRKWRQRTNTADAPMGPKVPKSTVLTPAEEAIVVAFRQKTLLPLDDVLGCLRDTIPNLSRSALHRCLQRHGVSRLPVEETKTQRKRFKTYEIGYVHIDSCELRHADGKLVMFLAIDRVSKFTYVEFHDSAGKMEGAAFDEIEANVPKDLDVHLVMDNYATHKTQLIRDWLAKRPRWHVHLTPTSSSWLNQVERFFALLTDRKIRRGVHRSVAELKADIAAFIEHHNTDPKPFRWTKSADDILASIERFCVRNTQATVTRTSEPGH